MSGERSLSLLAKKDHQQYHSMHVLRESTDCCTFSLFCQFEICVSWSLPIILQRNAKQRKEEILLAKIYLAVLSRMSLMRSNVAISANGFQERLFISEFEFRLHCLCLEER